MNIWLATGKEDLLIVLGASEALKLAKDYHVYKTNERNVIEVIFDDYFEDKKKRIHKR